jgi:hypothetical protein
MLPVFGSAALVAALTAEPPVKLTACEVSTPVKHLHMGRDIGTTYSGNYALHVRFSDVGRQPVTRVVFALSDGSKVAVRGTFSPGVSIRKTLELAPTNDDSCAVASVTFANGTRWTPTPASG